MWTTFDTPATTAPAAAPPDAAATEPAKVEDCPARCHAWRIVDAAVGRMHREAAARKRAEEELAQALLSAKAEQRAVIAELADAEAEIISLRAQLDAQSVETAAAVASHKLAVTRLEAQVSSLRAQRNNLGAALKRRHVRTRSWLLSLALIAAPAALGAAVVASTALTAALAGGLIGLVLALGAAGAIISRQPAPSDLATANLPIIHPAVKP